MTRDTDSRILVCSLALLGTPVERVAAHHAHPSFLDADSLTFQSLNALDVKRRVILTGTPIQVSRLPLLPAHIRVLLFEADVLLPV